ncbi:hypothetical protein AAZX31_08G293300 [Glycine max]|uniref:ADP-ribosyl cyclase/cyclic ADP-ribose hydrolase n=1 Tax=Glycine max TaxID=3847 RepID=K7L9W3_SOYBN|nr:disease resistance protein RPV1 isoform X2 [Glycine max]XP_040860629.1 disease resistance protein RPV1 isoform X2 [Glycine max]XP_040860630.1 disease resistance protein RPV1 isoform X2 [Glycine max]KAG5001858.1 hypothetical protein JHK87_022930 [Glycine soja]KAH1053884.1 hypothetical protein GYH30_022905 [Glycine max]KAH1053888.1 hypothetical protein GYH30_022905 [Glycine max]KAH1053889.1 hypothetical protein GYH30_022905 [Glycine max]KAH1053890.1 hypothetical protein GYH30_022905 [Glycin|eukprot:XP_003530712.1 TMV resistance protein N isoform X2 [Glycine max]
MNEQQRITDVASSSNSSSMSSSKQYDVFLSFRGEDTRRSFTSHLYESLNEVKVQTYIDDRLEKGEEISPTLTKAIENSRVSIVIFSENYASSKWCLGELIKIMESKKEKGQIVIPVFYNIDPSHVRKQTGSYEQAFEKHEGEPRCNKWKTALTEAAGLAGFDSRNYRTDPELLKDIVGAVLRKLPPRYQNQRKGLIGIEDHCKQIESLLKIGSSEVKTLGIWGMGGIGKTTLATTLYDKLSHKFEDACFLANLSEQSDKPKNRSFGNFDMANLEQLDKNHSRLQDKKVLIILDDVTTSEQLDKIIPDFDCDFLGPGSRVIVTTRDKQILSRVDEIYPVGEWSFDKSLQLFCLTAFGEKQPNDGYADLSRMVVSYCKGIPLALKVLGASLRSRSKEIWECELRKLQKIPNKEIHKVLKLSYDGLDRSEQDIFLDIACFFKGRDRCWVTRVLEAFEFFPAPGINILLDKALITISDSNLILMHDLIQEMGREIVHQESKDPGRRTRLWRHEEVHDVLKYNKGTDVVEGISLDLSRLNEDLNLSSNSLAKMTNLRFLRIDGESWLSDRIFNGYLPNGLESLYLSNDVEPLYFPGLESLVLYFPNGHVSSYLPNGLESFYFLDGPVSLYLPNGLESLYFPSGLESLSNQLRYLHWDLCYLESLPPNFCAEQLVVLHMKFSKLKKLWDGVQNLVNLKEIDLSYSEDLIEIPNLSEAENLESISLSGCKSLHKLHVHSKSLRAMELDGCSSLKEFSVTSEKMTKLNLSYTNISELSSSIGHLVSLEKLYLRGTNVESLPANIKNLSMLTSLRLDGCRKLMSLPELPPSLRLLDINGCKKLMSPSQRHNIKLKKIYKYVLKKISILFSILFYVVLCCFMYNYVISFYSN